MILVQSLRVLSPGASLARGIRTTVARALKDQVKIDVTKDYYAILGVMPDATSTEIREAFYDTVKTCHPDVNAAPSAKREFEYAQEAFAVLKNPISRKEYDLKADVERTLEQKAEGQETLWMARREVRPGKIWSEKLAKDLLRASALRTLKRRESAAEAAKRSRSSWIRGQGQEEARTKPRTLAEEVQWEEGKVSRFMDRVVPPAPDLQEVPKRGMYVTLVTLFFVAVYVAGSSGYLWEIDERQARRLNRRWEDRPSTLEIFTKERQPEPWTPGKYTERYPYLPLPDRE